MLFGGLCPLCQAVAVFVSRLVTDELVHWTTRGYITEAGSLDPMLEFARKPSEAKYFTVQAPPLFILRGKPYAKLKQSGPNLLF
jgi:hypothetical protein